ncbi:NAD(P)H-binding protein [Alteromonas sp. H39]|uniref:NAD(P)H-binding protein n=1 Tax=Alteromonas sp. H39 TaxID=3389876 RepID=UPI0039E04393
MQHNLVLCGHGWLGGYLAATCPDAQITATTRTAEKQQALAGEGIHALCFSLGDDPSQLVQASKDATVILNIPPGRRSKDLGDFRQQMCELVDGFMEHNARQVVFISTTSVYGDETDGTVTETSATDPQTESAKAHVAIEKHIQHYPANRYTILRLAGLTGPDRHPVNMLSGKHFSSGNKVVNLVHIHDVTTALTRIIERGGKGEVLHLCSLSHPKRGDYYSRCAHERGLPPPTFDDTTAVPVGKQIDATWSWEQLGVTPAYPTVEDMM